MCYKYDPPEVLEIPDYVMYWYRPIFTYKQVAHNSHNKPDKVVINKTEKSATIIEIAIPPTHNVKSTEGEKIKKYI